VCKETLPSQTLPEVGAEGAINYLILQGLGCYYFYYYLHSVYIFAAALNRILLIKSLRSREVSYSTHSAVH